MLTKKRTFEILNKAKYGDTASRIFDISLTILIKNHIKFLLLIIPKYQKTLAILIG